MNWVLDHFQVLAPIAAVVAYWISQLLSTAGGKRSGPAAGPPGPLESGPEIDENTRRIQEEIRRKIAERRSGSQPPAPPRVPEPPPAPPVLAPRPVAEGLPRGLRERLEARVAEVRAREEAAERERQRQAQEDRQAMAGDRAAAERPTALAPLPQPAPSATTAVTAGPVPVVGRRWLGTGLDAPTLRRAIVLREILDPPVGLR